MLRLKNQIQYHDNNTFSTKLEKYVKSMNEYRLDYIENIYEDGDNDILNNQLYQLGQYACKYRNIEAFHILLQNDMDINCDTNEDINISYENIKTNFIYLIFKNNDIEFLEFLITNNYRTFDKYVIAITYNDENKNLFKYYLDYRINNIINVDRKKDEVLSLFTKNIRSDYYSFEYCKLVLSYFDDIFNHVSHHENENNNYDYENYHYINHENDHYIKYYNPSYTLLHIITIYDRHDILFYIVK